MSEKFSYAVTIEVPMEITVTVELDQELSGDYKEDNDMLANTIKKNFWGLYDNSALEKSCVIQEIDVVDVCPSDAYEVKD